MSDIIIVRDDREREGYWFEDAEVERLLTADYTARGYESLIAIERKKSINEVSNNLCGADRARFEAELTRLQTYRHAIIIVERPFSDVIAYPYIKDIKPWLRKRLKVRGPYLTKRLCEVMAKYHVPWMFCANAREAQSFALAWIKACVTECDANDTLPPLETEETRQQENLQVAAAL